MAVSLCENRFRARREHLKKMSEHFCCDTAQKRPESGLDCLTCAELPQLRQGHLVEDEKLASAFVFFITFKSRVEFCKSLRALNTSLSRNRFIFLRSRCLRPSTHHARVLERVVRSKGIGAKSQLVHLKGMVQRVGPSKGNGTYRQLLENFKASLEFLKRRPTFKETFKQRSIPSFTLVWQQVTQGLIEKAVIHSYLSLQRFYVCFESFRSRLLSLLAALLIKPRSKGNNQSIGPYRRQYRMDLGGSYG